jgi:hypothetical protein
MKIKMIQKISRVAILLGVTFAALQLLAQAQSLTLSTNPRPPYARLSR